MVGRLTEGGSLVCLMIYDVQYFINRITRNYKKKIRTFLETIPGLKRTQNFPSLPKGISVLFFAVVFFPPPWVSIQVYHWNFMVIIIIIGCKLFSPIISNIKL